MQTLIYATTTNDLSLSFPTVLPKVTLQGSPGPHTAGSEVILTCEVAGGYPLPEVKWLVDDLDAEVTTTEFEVTVTEEMDGAKVKCVAANEAGEVTSEELVLIVGGEFDL